MNVQSMTPDAQAIQSWSIAYIAKTLDIPPEKIDPTLDVDRLGLDSTTAVAYMMSLEEWLGLELTPELLFQHSTIARLSTHLATFARGSRLAGA